MYCHTLPGGYFVKQKFALQLNEDLGYGELKGLSQLKQRQC